MNRCVPMTLCTLMLLGLSRTVLAVAQPWPQEAVRTAEGAPAPRARTPLFQVRYVLVKATPTPPQDELPLDFGNGEAAIRSIRLSGGPGVQLKSGERAPNTFVCYGWSCMDSLPR